LFKDNHWSKIRMFRYYQIYNVKLMKETRIGYAMAEVPDICSIANPTTFVNNSSGVGKKIHTRRRL